MFAELKRRLTIVAVLCFAGTASPIAAEELDQRTTPANPKDWVKLHRAEYQRLSWSVDGPTLWSLHAEYGTFIRAAQHNLSNNLPGEYKNVEQRTHFTTS
jgi:hypothetical protein